MAGEVLKLMYKPKDYSISIDVLEVVKETDKMVAVRERVQGWRGEPDRYRESRIRKDGLFNTWEEARDALVNRLQNRIRGYEANMQSEKEDLKKAASLKKPEIAKEPAE